MFALLCGRFKKEFGHTKVPVFYTGYNNLGRWAKRMRDGIHNEEPWMDEVRKTRLLGIDFDIAARHVFGHKPKKKTDDGEKELDEEMDEIEVEEVVGPVVEAQAVAAAATMARMDSTDYGRPSIPPFFYHGYPPAHLYSAFHAIIVGRFYLYRNTPSHAVSLQ